MVGCRNAFADNFQNVGFEGCQSILMLFVGFDPSLDKVVIVSV